jgi:hypothetical protein
VLAHRHAGHDPLVVAVHLDGQVDHVARRTLRVQRDPAVQQVTEHEQLVRPFLEAPEVQRAAVQHHALRVHRRDVADRQEDAPAQRHLGHQADDLRRAVGGPQPHHRVPDPPDPVAVGVENGQAGEPRQIHPRPHGHGFSLG